jgi:hypothetical protein
MSKVQKISLVALARAAGLSKATVSRALRNDPRQSGATRTRVQGLARRLGYRPHPMVTALMTQIRVGRRPRFRGLIGILDLWPERRGWASNPMVPPFLEGGVEWARPRLISWPIRSIATNAAFPICLASRWCPAIGTKAQPSDRRRCHE